MIRTIIDGYNLIFQCGFHPRNLDSALALHRARQRLIDELALRLQESDRHEVIIIFDAKNPKGVSTPDLTRKGFKVAFARDYEDADSMIIDMIRTHSQPRQLTVASNDHMIQTAASRRHAKAIDSDFWFDGLGLIAHQDHALEDSGKDRQLLTDAETRQLIEEFSDPEIDISKPQRKDDPDDNQPDSPYNPFPPGYGEDLL